MRSFLHDLTVVSAEALSRASPRTDRGVHAFVEESLGEGHRSVLGAGVVTRSGVSERFVGALCARWKTMTVMGLCHGTSHAVDGDEIDRLYSGREVIAAGAQRRWITRCRSSRLLARYNS